MNYLRSQKQQGELTANTKVTSNLCVLSNMGGEGF